jgi:hypothetical protein
MSSSDLAVGQRAFAITPHNTTKFATRARAVYVGVGGDITIVPADGIAVLLVAVPQGTILPVECVRVNATGTTATSLVGLV